MKNRTAKQPNSAGVRGERGEDCETAQTLPALMKPYIFGIDSFSPFTHQASSIILTIAGRERNLLVIE